jgi:hypothetical protein
MSDHQTTSKPSISLILAVVMLTLAAIASSASACTWDLEFKKTTEGDDTWATAAPGANSACTLSAPAEAIQMVDVWDCRGNFAVVPETDLMGTSTEVCTDQTGDDCRDIEEFTSGAVNDYINFQGKPWRWIKIINTTTAGTYRMHCLGAQ